MHCPSCGTATATDQRFCRLCGLSLEAFAQLLGEEMPVRIDPGTTKAKARQARTECLARLGFWGISVLAIAGAALFAAVAYKIIDVVIIEKGEVFVGLSLLLALVGGGMAVTSLGYADAVRKFKTRDTDDVDKARPLAVPARRSVDASQAASVTEGTTEFLESCEEEARPLAPASRAM